ncbi:MAG: glycosyltransferase family 4 protein [Patescibacteria group bacterium]
MTPQRDVIVLTTAYDPFIGGAELAAREVMRRIPDVQFTVLTARFRRNLPAYELQGNIVIYRLGIGSAVDKYLLPVLAYRTGKRLLRPSTAVWCVMVSYASIAGYYLKRTRPDLRLILTLQEGDVIEGRKFGLVPLWWKRLLSVANEVHAISNYLADLARHFGYQKEIHIIPNGVDVELFARRDETRIAKIQERYALSRFPFVLISVSRLVEKNGLADVIRALPGMPDVGFMMVGEGPLRASLITLSKSLGVSDRVIFVGSVPLEEVPPYLHASDAFIRLSKSEGLGTAFLEAMAAGLPIIATRVGGIPDFLKDGDTGISVMPDDTAAVIRAVSTIRQKEQGKQFIANSMLLVRDRYAWDSIAQKISAVLQASHI